jgi:hypothetical protein
MVNKSRNVASAIIANSNNQSLSPLVQSYNNQFNINQPYGASLPRPVDMFTNGSFAPSVPIHPMPIDTPAVDGGRPDPRRFQYPQGWNLPTGQPGTEGLKLASFATLRSLADSYSVVRSCINIRKHEIMGLNWEVVPTKEAEKAMKDDDTKRAEFDKRKAQVEEFFQHPDADKAKYPTFESWLGALLESLFVTDAMALHVHPTRVKGKGPFGSDLASLDIIDATTIRPMLDLHGQTPSAPNVAYQQYLWGVARLDMMSIIQAEDIETMDEPVREYRSDQLMYLRYCVRDWTPYGFSPVEMALLPASIGFARQQWQWDYFQEGSIPGQFVVPGPDFSTPQQVRQLQDALNSMAGDIGNRHRIIVLPHGSATQPQKHMLLADQFDEWVISQVCMPFMLTPLDLGVTPRVSAIQSNNMSNQLSNINTDKGSQERIEPLTSWLKTTIFDYVIQGQFKQSDMEWSWGLTERGENKEQEINQHIQLVTYGMESIDEARMEMGKAPWGLPETTVPMAWTMAVPQPLTEITSDEGEVDDSGRALPTNEDLTSPHHHGSGAVVNDPNVAPKKPPTVAKPQVNSKPDGPSQQGEGVSKTAELEILARQMRNGKDPRDFISAALTKDTLEETYQTLVKKGVAAASMVAKNSATRGTRQGLRDNSTARIRQDVKTQLSTLVTRYRAGNISSLSAVDSAVQVMYAAYLDAMNTGSQHAASDYKIPVKDFKGDAHDRAEIQRHWLKTLFRKAQQVVAKAPTMAGVDNSIDSYAATVNGAYSTGYGETVVESGGDWTIHWELGAAINHCKECIARDGITYTIHDFPGWPGDGDFGGSICMGGPNCSCTVSFVEDTSAASDAVDLSDEDLTGGNTQRDTGGIDYYSSQNTAIADLRDETISLRDEFLSTIPSDAAARAYGRDEVRAALAALENARIQSTPGGYSGVSVAPADISAQAVAARVSKSDSMKPTTPD